MSLLLSLFVGFLFGSAVYLLLQRRRFDTLLGFAILSNAVNLAILTGSGWSKETQPPILNNNYEKVKETGAYISTVSPDQYADPIPQALILTAIVIGFALISFLMVLAAELTQRESEEKESAQ